MKAAENRKRENERRTERVVQKEREEEKGKYNDSEVFVTGAYRKKMLEMQKLEDEEKRKDQMEGVYFMIIVMIYYIITDI